MDVRTDRSARSRRSVGSVGSVGIVENSGVVIPNSYAIRTHILGLRTDDVVAATAECRVVAVDR